MRVPAWVSVWVLLGASLGCGRSDECATLERLCLDQCGPGVKRSCIEIVAQADDELCRASYRTFARYCPDWDLFVD